MKASFSDERFEELYAKLKIHEQLHRWTRGADRNDLEIMRSVFHPGANINYGYRNGPVEEFLPWVIKFHNEDILSSSHIIFNVLQACPNVFRAESAGCRLDWILG
jgi:hypothetical protein